MMSSFQRGKLVCGTCAWSAVMLVWSHDQSGSLFKLMLLDQFNFLYCVRNTSLEGLDVIGVCSIVAPEQRLLSETRESMNMKRFC